MRWRVKGQRINSGVEQHVWAQQISVLWSQKAPSEVRLSCLFVSSNMAEQQPREDRFDGVCFVIKLLLTRCSFPRRGWEEHCIWSSLLCLIRNSSSLNKRWNHPGFVVVTASVMSLQSYTFSRYNVWLDPLLDRSKKENITDVIKTQHEISGWKYLRRARWN